jgi:signal transduction histidine kinase
MLLILPTLAALASGIGILVLALLCIAAVRRQLRVLAAFLAALQVLFAAMVLYKVFGLLHPVVEAAFLLRAGQSAALTASLLTVWLCMDWAQQSRPLIGALAAGLSAVALAEGVREAVPLCMAVAIAACWRAGQRSVRPTDRRFYRLFGATLVLPGLIFALSLPLELTALAFLLPASALFLETLRRNVLGLLVARRMLLILLLGGATVAYLIVVKVVADSVSNIFDTFASVLEIGLIVAAAVLWLPLLSWTGRMLDRRAALYAEFGKRVIDQAAPVLDPQKRADHLARGVRGVLQVRAAHLSLAGGAQALGKPQETGTTLPAECIAEAEALLRESEENCVRRVTARGQRWEALFASAPFNYVLPVRYEGEFMAILWVDASPKEYLDEYEPVLLDLCRQMGHSLETCRILDEKIQLERSLMAQEQVAALGNVAATIAHEVKNPLSSIRALTQLMLEDPEFGARYARDLGYILGETDRLNASVRQLLSFARPLQAEPSDVDLSAIVLAIVDTVKRDQREHPIELSCLVKPDLILHRAGSQSVEQIVWNLLLNAVQAAGQQGSIVVTAEAAGPRRIRLRITDDGPGIPLAQQQRIFEPYFTTRLKGTGLGLSIVLKNVRHLRGDVQVQSPVASGKGACFTVELPQDREETVV